jgi:Flp pilus assembly protein TadG
MNAPQPRALRRSSPGGQALVEFALVVPIFLLLLLAVIEFGRFILAYEAANHAVREGTRYAIVHGYYSIAPAGPSPASPDNACPPTTVSTTAVSNVVQQNAYTLPPATTIAVCWPDGTNLRGNRVSVSADFPFRVLFPLVPLPPLTIHAESTLVVNN